MEKERKDVLYICKIGVVKFIAGQVRGFDVNMVASSKLDWTISG